MNFDFSTIKGYIFDFDGVILDTEKYHYAAWKKTFADVGYDLSMDEYEPLKSTGKKHIIGYAEQRLNTVFDEATRTTLAKNKSSYYSDMIQSISKDDFIAGVLDFIGALRANNRSIAVASSSATARGYIERFGIAHLFDVVIDGNDNCPQKPLPDIFLLALKRLGLAADECIVFEDSLAGLTAASRAGIKAVYVGQTHADLCELRIKDFCGLHLS